MGREGSGEKFRWPVRSPLRARGKTLELSLPYGTDLAKIRQTEETSLPPGVEDPLPHRGCQAFDVPREHAVYFERPNPLPNVRQRLAHAQGRF